MELELIYTDIDYNEVGFFDSRCEIDMELGSVVSAESTNDFQISMPISSLPSQIEEGSLIYEIGTEYGGIVTGFGADTDQSKAYIYGITWRGMLARKAIVPASGQAYFICQGEASAQLSRLIDDKFEGLIIADTEQTPYNVSKQFRYVMLLKGIEQMLSAVGARIRIHAEYMESGKIQALVGVTAISDLSDEYQFDNDYGMTMSAKKNRVGVTHVICLGQGELTERTVIELYKDADGNITQDSSKQAYFGLDDYTAIYDYSSCETEEELIEGGEDKFDELCDEESLEISLGENVEIGDIVAAKEQITGISMNKQVSQKILKGYMNDVDIEFTVGEE